MEGGRGRWREEGGRARWIADNPNPRPALLLVKDMDNGSTAKLALYKHKSRPDVCTYLTTLWLGQGKKKI